MSATTEDTLDPITFEVLGHKLDEIVAEAYHTIGRVSGSPVVYEAGDHQEAILTPAGELAAFGAGVLHWTRSISEGVKHVAKTYAENPGFEDGDQFFLNDPYLASVHAPDIQLLAPIFWEGELVAWAGAASHQIDVGGLHPGGHQIGVSDCFGEGFQSRGFKFVEQGVIRKDLEDTFANLVRQPALGLLDIRAKIAANNVLRERLLALIERFGIDTVKTLMRQIIDYSESRMRSRLASLADGEWTTTSYVEGIAEPTLGVRLTLKKRGDTALFDFTGSSPQSAGPENIGIVGAKSCAMVALIVTLAHDLPWNEGLLKPIDYVLPEESIVNPKRPAPLSAASPSGGSILATSSAQTVVAKMLAANENVRHEAVANTGGSFNVPIIAGLHRDGTHFTTQLLEMLAGGGGAQSDRDGDDSAHNGWCVKTMIPNVETNEQIYPIMYLWRREVTDSAGAGKHRGGLGMSMGLLPWGTVDLHLVTVGCGVSSRGTLGAVGGYPGANAPLRIVRGADVERTLFPKGMPGSDPETIPGETDRIAQKGVTRLAATDVLEMHVSTGGGGYGDPIDRDPDRVRADVAEGVVSPEMAERAYGVVLGDRGEVDREATSRTRDAIRASRFERAGTSSLLSAADRAGLVTDDLVQSACRYCEEGAGATIGDGSAARFEFDAPVDEGAPASLAAVTADFTLRHSCCAGCGRLMDMDLVPTGTPEALTQS